MYSSEVIVRIVSHQVGDDLPYAYARIEHCFVYDDQKVFVVNVLHIVAVNYHDLYSAGVLHMKERDSESFVVEKCFILDSD